MFQEIAEYIKRGFYIFPINKNTKKPAIKDNLNLASIDFNQILKWSVKFPGCNWGLSLAKSKLVAVDVDTKHGGLETWATLLHKNGKPKTLIQQSGSGGYHYVFNAINGTKYRGKIVDGIDVKHNGYIVIQPSIHETTKGKYQWKNWGKINIGEAPEWINELIIRTDNAGKNSPIRGLGKGLLKRYVDKLKEVELSYEDWVHAGMALHSAQPNEIGLDLFLDLTEGCNYEDGDVETAAYKWEGFNASGGVSVRTLYHLLRTKGLAIPAPTIEEDIELFKQAERNRIAKKVEDAEGFEPLRGRWICWNEKTIVDWFNNNGFAFCEMDLKRPFIKIRGGERGKYTTQGMDLFMLKNLTAMYFYAHKKETAAEVRTEYTSAHKSWVESRHRKTYEKLVFDPKMECGENGKIFNIWAGINFPTCKGEPEIILDLIGNALCAGHEDKKAWFLDFLAHIMQKPAQKPSVVPVFIGRQGAGKGLITEHVLRPILGDLYLVVKTSAELTDKFNDFQVGRLLTHIDEATWRGNKTEDGILKNIIGSETLNIEEKFGMKYTINNFSRYMVSSNNLEAVALEIGNRRYCVFETNDDLADSEKYFKPMGRKLREDKDELGRFYNFLLERDISNFNPYKILAGNTAGMESKIATEGVVAEFWHDCLFESPVPIMWENNLHKRLAYIEFLNFAKKVRSYEKSCTPKFFWSKTKRLLPIVGKADTTQKFIDGRRDRVFENVAVAALQQCFIDNIVIEPESELPESGDYQIETLGGVDSLEDFLS